MTIATSFPWLLQSIMKSLSTPVRIVHIISVRIKWWLDSNKFIGICLDSNKFIGICDLLEDSNNLLESGKVWLFPGDVLVLPSEILRRNRPCLSLLPNLTLADNYLVMVSDSILLFHCASSNARSLPGRQVPECFSCLQ